MNARGSLGPLCTAEFRFFGSKQVFAQFLSRRTNIPCQDEMSPVVEATGQLRYLLVQKPDLPTVDLSPLGIPGLVPRIQT